MPLGSVIPAARVLTAAPTITVARPALGLTLYLAEPIVWAREGGAAMFEAFRTRAPGGLLRWYTDSQLTDWFRVGGDRLDEIGKALSLWIGRPRQLLQVRVVDDTGAPSTAFTYREVDPRRTVRAATLELVLPAVSSPALLVELAAEAASRWPVLSGVGGHLATWNPHEKPTAFWDIHDWCKRFVGLDVQDADAMAWHAFDGLPGSGWLTLVGNAAADRLRLDLAALAAGPWKHGVKATPLAHGLLLQAGPAPVLGDLNHGEFPWAYAEVARRLAPAFLNEPPPFWGGFRDHGDTVAWLRRLVEPEGWR
jgi:hypothetical protein